MSKLRVSIIPRRTPFKSNARRIAARRFRVGSAVALARWDVDIARRLWEHDDHWG
jgi:hypothetical protein